MAEVRWDQSVSKLQRSDPGRLAAACASATVYGPCGRVAQPSEEAGRRARDKHGRATEDDGVGKEELANKPARFCVDGSGDEIGAISPWKRPTAETAAKKHLD